MKYGVPLAAACAEAGTHYCDLTGEVLFVHRSIAANHETAQRTGARIIHACGFDSIPSDLGVCSPPRRPGPTGPSSAAPTSRCAAMKGGFSGGTIDSARTQVDELKYDKAARRVVGDPWALAEGGRPPRRRPATAASGDGSGKRGRPRRRRSTRLAKASPVKRDADNGHFTGPFVMAAFNTRIVARSASLLGYGDGFRYVEYSDYGAGPAGAVAAGGMSVALGAGLAGLAFAPTRALLDRVLPKPGRGPERGGPGQRAGSGWRSPREATNGARYRTTVAAPYDPGYSGTAVMLGPGSAQPSSRTATGCPMPRGCSRPRRPSGAPLVDRLRAHRFTLETERLPG